MGPEKSKVKFMWGLMGHGTSGQGHLANEGQCAIRVMGQSYVRRLRKANEGSKGPRGQFQVMEESRLELRKSLTHIS